MKKYLKSVLIALMVFVYLVGATLLIIPVALILGPKNLLKFLMYLKIILEIDIESYNKWIFQKTEIEKGGGF